MKTLYLECAMGAAGDMLMAALYELCPEKERFLADMNRLIPGAEVRPERVTRQGIAGTHMRVVINGQEEGRDGPVQDHPGHDHHHDHDRHDHDHSHHAHRSLADIQAVIEGFALPPAVRENARRAYGLIAQAEARAHGVPVGEVHFHEVGSLDAVMDVTGVCYLMELLGPDRVAASAVTVGSGTVRTAHGLLPVPAPATAELLRGVPVSPGDIASELCTPTGAALLRTFAGDFGPMPAGTLLGCGCGCGARDFPRANCLRAFLLDTAQDPTGPNDAVTELRANIDDMTGEDLGFAMERLLAAGALDVSYVPLQMKKGRPGVLLICLCLPADADRLAGEILRHTATFGVRRFDCARYALAADPNPPTVETEYGPIRRKAGMGWGVVKCKPEYEDLAAAARAGNIPLAAVREAFEKSR